MSVNGLGGSMGGSSAPQIEAPRPPPPPPPPAAAEKPAPKRDTSNVSSFEPSSRPKLDLMGGAPRPELEAKSTQSLGGTTLSTVTPAETFKADELRTHTKNLKSVNDTVREAERERGVQLGSVAGALAPEDRKRFETEFNRTTQFKVSDPDIRKMLGKETATYDELKKVQNQLADKVEAQLRSPDVAKKVTSASQAQDLLEGVRSLAGAQRGAAAIEIGSKLSGLKLDTPSLGLNTQREFGEIFRGDLEKVIEQATPSAVQELIAKVKPPEHMVHEFAALLGTGKAAGPFKDAIKLLTQFDEKAERGTITVNYLLETARSPIGKAMMGAGIAFGAVGVFNGFKDGNYAAVLQGLASVAQGASQYANLSTSLVTDALSSTRSALATLPAKSQFLLRAAPGLGALASTASALSRFLKPGDPNFGTYVAAAGDFLSAAGSLINTSVVGVPLGLVVQGLGAAVTALGESIESSIKKDERRRQTDTLLEKLGVDKTTRDAVLASKPESLAFLSAAGYSHTEVAKMVVNDPRLRKFDAGLFQQVYRDADLSRSQVVDLIQRYGELPPGYMSKLATFAMDRKIGGAKFTELADAIAKDNKGGPAGFAAGMQKVIVSLTYTDINKRSDPAYINQEIKHQLRNQGPNTRAFFDSFKPPAYTRN